MPLETNGRVNGPTILLGSGRYFDVEQPLTPPPTIEDIAYGLAFERRWSGQCIQRSTGRRVFFGVAQHCVHMQQMILESVDEFHRQTNEMYALRYAALMHELEEFCWGDMNGPLKVQVPGYRDITKSTYGALARYYKVSTEFDDVIKLYDKRMMATERRDLSSWNGTDFWGYTGDAEPFESVIEPWTGEVAAIKFLNLFNELKPEGAPS